MFLEDTISDREKRLQKCHLARLIARSKSKIGREVGLGERQTVSRSPMSEIRCENNTVENGNLVKIHRAYLNESGYKVGWVLDYHKSACFLCNSRFTFFRRRHHCRQCGDVVCNSCSKNRYVIRGLREAGGSRTCDGCVVNARQSFEWDWQEGPLERAETVVPGFSDDPIVHDADDMTKKTERVDTDELVAEDIEDEQEQKYNSASSSSSSSKGEEEEIRKENVLPPQPLSTRKLHELLEQRIGLDSALDAMHKYVDRLVLNDTCDTSRSVLLQSTSEQQQTPAHYSQNGSCRINKVESSSHITPPAMYGAQTVSSSENTDRSLGSKVLQDVMERGVWESDSPFDNSPAALQSPPSAQSLGTVGSVHISDYGADSTRANRILKEINANGIWEAGSNNSKQSMASMKVSPPCRVLGRDFDGEEPSPIVYSTR